VLRSRFVLTCADLWPESFVASGVMRQNPLMRLFFAYSAWLHRRADFVICSTRGTLERCHRDGVPREKLAYVPVWVQGIGEAGAGAGSAGGRRIVYAGNLGPAQKLDTLVRAAALMYDAGMDVSVDMYGSGAAEEELRALSSRLGAANVMFHGRVSPDEAFRLSSGAFAQVVSLQPSALFRETIPSKLPFAFAAGAPVLYGLEGEAAAVAAESGGGIAFDANDPESLVAAVNELLSRSDAERERMRGALREYYERNFARETLLARYRQILRGRRYEPRETVVPRTESGT
jgi:colanic acid biosynthesis glycosyl transferase WcaI